MVILKLQPTKCSLMCNVSIPIIFFKFSQFSCNYNQFFSASFQSLMPNVFQKRATFHLSHRRKATIHMPEHSHRSFYSTARATSDNTADHALINLSQNYTKTLDTISHVAFFMIAIIFALVISITVISSDLSQ